MSLHIVDPSGWIEYFTDGPGADNFTPVISDESNLIVPAIVIFEVAKLLLRLHDEEHAKAAVAQLSTARVEPLVAEIASDAAIVSIRHHLPMAGSIIYATAQRFDATLWTQDADFEGLPGVRYFTKSSL